MIQVSKVLEVYQHIVTFGSFSFHGSQNFRRKGGLSEKLKSRRESWITFAKEIRWEILKREESQCKKIKEGLREARASQTTAVAKARAGAPLPFSTTVSIHMLKFSVSIDLNQFKGNPSQPVSTYSNKFQLVSTHLNPEMEKAIWIAQI